MGPMRRRGLRLTATTGLLAALLITPSAAFAEPATRSISTGGDGMGELRISTATAKPHARATASGTVSVAILDFLFEPQDITVGVGDTVSWTNEGEKKHDVDGDGFESETLETGESYSFTFSDSGTFDYICGIHPKMKATVTVAGTPSDPDPPAGEEPKEGDAGTTDSGTGSGSAGRGDSGDDGSGANKSEEGGGGVSPGGESGDGGGDGSGGSLPSTGQDLLPAIILAELLLIAGLALRLRLP